MFALTVRSQELTGAPPTRVALWVEEPLMRARCKAALAGFAVEEIADATDLKAPDAPALLVASWRDGLGELALGLNLQLVVIGDTMPEPLVDAVARGLFATVVAQPDRLREDLRRFGRAARASDGKRHRITGASVRVTGVAASLPLCDLSNDGLSFSTGDAPIDALLPGSELGAIEVSRDGRVCMDGVVARVRHLEPLDAGGYRVGCALEPPAAPAPRRRTLLRDRALCAALVKAGARGGIALEPLERDERGTLDLALAHAHVDVAAGTITADVDGALPELALVRGRFEAFGRLYRFTSVVVGRDPLRIKLPAALEESHQRAAARYRPAADAPLVVELSSPLSGAVAKKPVLDVSSTGFSFALDGARDLFPLGLRVGVLLHLPDGPLAATGSVRTLLRDGDRLRCGVELDTLDAGAHVRMCDLLLRRRGDGIGDGTGLPFDELAAFFRRTGFLPPDKEAVLAPMMPSVQKTFEATYGRPSKLFQAVVSRADGAVTGHVSVVRAYQHTGMTHHLAAESGRHVAHLLNISAAEYFGLSPDLEYGKIWFHADNKWPARVFGSFARIVRDSSQSELRANVHLTLPTGASFGEAPADLEIVDADARDLATVEHYFVARERGLLLRADDLLRNALTLEPVDKQFAELGLFRRRRVLMAVKGGVRLGFAFAELSSPGLNLYETLSMFRTFVLPEGAYAAPMVRLALLNYVSRLYHDAGRPFMRGIFAPEETDDYARLGLTSHERSFTWTWHRGLCPRFCYHVERMFEALRRRGAGDGSVSA